MRNAGNKRLVLLLLTLAMLVCGVMALGGTFASGVDRDSQNGTDVEKQLNNYTHDDYRVDLLFADGEGFSSFQSKNPFDSILWCPGYTGVVTGKIVNEEEFPVECTLSLKVSNNQLGTVMKYAALSTPSVNSSQYTNWREFEEAAEKKGILEDGIHQLFYRVVVNSDSCVDYAFAVHMDENANEKYKGKTMGLDYTFTVEANYQPGENSATDSPQ